MSWMILFKKQRRSLRYTTHRLMVMHPHTNYHWPISKEKNVMARTRKYYLKNNYFIWPWGQRSRSNEGHYGTRHTVLWSCTHIPNSLTYLERQKSYGPAKVRWEAEEKIRLKQYFSLRSKGRHNNLGGKFFSGSGSNAKTNKILF
jgi:hypothetical protein